MVIYANLICRCLVIYGNLIFFAWYWSVDHIFDDFRDRIIDLFWNSGIIYYCGFFSENRLPLISSSKLTLAPLWRHKSHGESWFHHCPRWDKHFWATHSPDGQPTVCRWYEYHWIPHVYIYIYIFVYIYIHIYIYMYISIHTIIISYGDMNIVYFQLYLLVVYLSMVARQDPIGWGTSKNHSQTTDHVALFHLQKYQRWYSLQLKTATTTTTTTMLYLVF